MLQDAAKIQMEDAAYKKKRHQKQGHPGRFPEVPLYDTGDVQETLPLLRPVGYRTPISVTDDISVTLYDAGHILGSAMLEVRVRENDLTRVLLFSGDVGQSHKPLIRDPSVFTHADYIVMESTYGDRLHEKAGDIESQLADVIQGAVASRGKVVIPTFAVERAQEVMYFISRLVHDGRVPAISVYLDSPMAVDVTEIFRKHHNCLDEETWRLISAGQAPLHFPGLRLARSTDESKNINRVPGPVLIMSTSGMCTAGRIKHHLRQNITSDRNTILFVGYQAEGTLGRQILDGSKQVRIHGQTWPVRARVAQIYGFSGHADRQGLLDWLGHLRTAPRQLFLTHGDEAAANSLGTHIHNHMQWPVTIPQYQSVYDLA
jgi:metallo-beta-lactamase family protein